MSLLECEPGTISYKSITCLPEEVYYSDVIQNSNFFAGFFLGIGSLALILSIACFIIFKVGKSKERILFRISLINLAIFFIALIIFGFFQ